MAVSTGQENTYYTADLFWQGLRVRNVAARSRGTGSRNPVKIGLRVDLQIGAAVTARPLDQGFSGLRGRTALSL